MDAAGMLRQWTGMLQGVFSALHGHQVKALAAMSLGMALARHCHLSQVALALPRSVRPLSEERRFQRLLANTRIGVPEVSQALSHYLLAYWSGRRVHLLLDETPLRDRLCVLKVSVGYRRRAVPLAWACYRPGQLPSAQPDLVRELLAQVARSLPPDLEVTVMADRGLAWPLLIDLCGQYRWHFTLRLQGQTHVLLPDGRECQLQQLASGASSQWTGSAQVFKQAGWRQANIVAVRGEDNAEPWLLATDHKPTLHRCQEYRKRMWQEESFRDEKSHGFQWQRSRVHDPAHADRLLLVMTLAMWLVLAWGTEVLKRGHRRRLEPARQRILSLFQLGLRWLHHQLAHAHAPPCRLRLYPTDPKIKSVG